MSYDISMQSSRFSMSKPSLSTGQHDSKYSDETKPHAPKAPSVTNLFKHFGGLDLEEESDISGEEDNANDPLLSITREQIKATQTALMKAENQEAGENGVIKTYFVLMKGFIGIGILYIPQYYNSIGYAITTGILLILSLMILCGLSKLVQCRSKTKVAYTTIAELASGKFLKVIVGILLFAGQIVYGTAYLAYIVSNVASMIMYPDPGNSTEGNILEWSIGSLLAVIIAPLMCIRRPDRFYPLFVVSSIVIIFALLGFAVPQAFSIKSVKFIAYKDDIALKKLVEFAGICLFSFEGYGIVIPSHQQMGLKKYYTPTFTICIASVFLFYAFFGALTSIEVNNGFHSAITFKALVDQLKLKRLWGYVVCSVYMACLIPGYLLTMYPSIRLAEKALGYILKRNGKKLWVQNVLRVLLVIATIVVATAWGWRFEKAIIIMGFFVCLPLTVIIPIFSHLKLVAMTGIEKFFDVALLLLGVGLVAVGVMYFV